MKTLGENLTATELDEFLGFLVSTNIEDAQSQARPTPICIWGTHGLGKTEIVVDFAKRNGWPLVYVAPAQFEEMGDLHGLPIKVQSKEGVVSHTAYLPPQWVPVEEGPGILVLDDINRADDRILRGLMQLLQNYEMFSWSLPPKWQIVCTANPDDGDYSVTAMDDAMLTRLLHVTLKLDIKSWASWAYKNGIDTRGIDFALIYPELLEGARTTPRSYVQFLQHIKKIKDLKTEIQRVTVLARATLDDETVRAFLVYINEGLEHLVHAEEILEAVDFSKVKSRIEDASKGKGNTIRLDRLQAICSRLTMAISSNRYEFPSELNRRNVVEFLLLDAIPADLRYSVHREISAMDGARNILIQDPLLAKAVLKMI
jgi:MoxR-like ATPase